MISAWLEFIAVYVSPKIPAMSVKVMLALFKLSITLGFREGEFPLVGGLELLGLLELIAVARALIEDSSIPTLPITT